MKTNWRNVKEKLPKSFDYYMCCNANVDEELGYLLYKPCCKHFVSYRSTEYLGGSRFIEEIEKNVTHWAKRGDLELPNSERLIIKNEVAGKISVDFTETQIDLFVKVLEKYSDDILRDKFNFTDDQLDIVTNFLNLAYDYQDK